MKSSPGYSASELVNMEYREVGGWMLWLCASLIIVGPARCVWDIWREFSHIPWSACSAATNVLRLLSYGFYMLIAVFGATAGVLLWRVHRNGREFVKAYLVVQFVSVLCLATLMMLAEDGTLDSVTDNASDAVARALVWTAVYGTVWWLYLDRSRRVRKTYELKHGGDAAQET